MPDILSIGASGLRAAQSALEVTGQNINNVDTPGYHRRELVTQDTVSTTGLLVTDVRRAFDELLSNRVRDAGSAMGAADAYQVHAVAIENTLIPGEADVTRALDRFFDAFDAVAQSPADTGLRMALLATGDALAAQVNGLHGSLSSIEAGIEAERQSAVDQANALLLNLGEVERALVDAVGTGTRNPLLDQREAMLGELARLMPVSVTVDDQGRADVRAGDAVSGPALLQFGQSSRLALGEGGRVSVLGAEVGAATVSLRPGGGMLGGLADASELAASQLSALDALATRIADDVNAVHRNGVTLDGMVGGDVFTVSGWTAEPGALTRGDASVSVMLTDAGSAPTGPLTLIYDAAADTWQAQDEAGDALGQSAPGSKTLSLPGLSISIDGIAADGDRTEISPSDGASRFFSMAISDPGDIAAGGAFLVRPGASNTGSASLTVATGQETTPGLGLPSLLTDFNAGDPVEFLTYGAVASIPSDVQSVRLTSVPRYAAMELSLPDGALVTGLEITQGGAAVSFTANAPQNADGFISDLNTGAILGSNGQSLPQLGLLAEISEAGLSLVSRQGVPLDAAVLATDMGNAVGAPTAQAAQASDLAVFTRDGRQIAGVPVTAEEAASLLTVDNGFYPEATYRFSGSIGAADGSRRSGTGDHVIAAAAASIGDYPSGTVPPEAPARSLTIGTGAGTDVVAIPPGASAAWTADIIAQSTGVDARAQTRLALDLPQTGTLTFDLIGTNTAGITIDVDLSTGGPQALAHAVNAYEASTGIRAEVSSDGRRIHLVHDAGADIDVSGMDHSGGSSITVSQLDRFGQVLNAGTLLPANGNALRVPGVVTVFASAEFSLSEGGNVSLSQPDTTLNGVIDVVQSAAGSRVVLSPAEPASGDQALRNVAVIGGDGRLHTATADPASASGASLASQLAEGLRATAPQSRLEGAPLASLPPDGARVAVSLGDQTYTVTMRGGIPEVEGPEPDRLAVRFGSDNRFIVETRGGHLDGAALQLASSGAGLSEFGLSPQDFPKTTVIGQPFEAGNLPSSLTVSVGGTSHVITVNPNDVVLPAAFPGTGFINTAYGRVEIQIDANAGDVSIPADAAAASAGFDTMGLTSEVRDGALTLSSTDGRNLNVTTSAPGAGRTIDLSDLAGEELIAVLTASSSGIGANRLSADIVADEPADRARELRVVDAAARQVAIFDGETGSELAVRTLDASGMARFGDLAFTLSGPFATGDTFEIAPSQGAPGDGRTASAVADLRILDSGSGRGGFGSDFSVMQQVAGADVAAGGVRRATAETTLSASQQAVSAVSDVDLDVEAARLIQQQQAYQANAQVIGVARTIFDTLLQSL